MPARKTANIRVTVESKCLHDLTWYPKLLQFVYWTLDIVPVTLKAV